ncbi:MAG: hypothetical protein MHPSP_004144, partial [Paramarteilia canceri]
MLNRLGLSAFNFIDEIRRSANDGSALFERSQKLFSDFKNNQSTSEISKALY